jgi:S1-C subfamily serine protease
LFFVLAAIAGLGTWELSRARARVDVLADELRRARAELGVVRDDFQDLRADLRSFAEQLPPAVPTLLDQVEQSVVAIRVGGKAMASGFAVEARALPKGYRSAILTRLWVGRAAKQGGSVVVIHGRRSFRLRPGEVDEENGLALLFTKAAVPSLPWATDDPRVGEFVAGVGLPGGRISVTTGVVTAIGPRALPTDARLTPGSGGGPVVNRRGEVVGVARAARDGLATATPIDRACRALVSC